MQPVTQLLRPAQQTGEQLHDELHRNEAHQQRCKGGEDLAETVPGHRGP